MDGFLVEKQVGHLELNELTDSQACIEHKQVHSVVADRLAVFVRSGGVAE